MTTKQPPCTCSEEQLYHVGCECAAERRIYVLRARRSGLYFCPGKNGVLMAEDARRWYHWDQAEDARGLRLWPDQWDVEEVYT